MPEDLHASRRYSVRHRTTYTYDADVTKCYERGFLAPRQTPTQSVLSTSLSVTPEPDFVGEHRDFFGNQSHYVEVLTHHRELEVVKEAEVEVEWPAADLDALNRWTIEEAVAAQAAGSVDRVDRATYTLPSQVVGDHPEVREYARTILAPDQPLGDALVSVYSGLHRDFTFKSGVTSVRTTLPEFLELGAGVCQDFTHLALGCLRAMGLPARYVSGYIETTPPPGKPRLAGSDASHAWVGVMDPEGGWTDLDPTNNHFADSRYVVTAWGRDFRDVSPLKGVIHTESTKSTLEVAVDIERLDPPQD